MLEDVGTKAAMRAAWRKVRANGGVAGIDRVSVEEFDLRCDEELSRLALEIKSGGYRPKPVMRMRPAFLATKDRALVVPTVRDRVAHRAIADYLVPRIDPVLSHACRAFRRGRSAQQTADDVGRWIEAGASWVLRADVRDFYDTIRPELLLEQLESFVDPVGLRLLGRIVHARVFDRDHVADMVVGIPQGSPLSPVLANLDLNEVDHAIVAEYARYARYCDDMIVCAETEDEARRAGALLLKSLEPLGLELNAEKTRLCRVEDGFVFLGYQFGPAGRGPAVKAIEALSFRLGELLAEPEPDLDALDALYRGWTGYFGEHPTVWQASPAGALALLRSGGGASVSESMCLARWRSSLDVSAGWALALGKAWAAAGRHDQAWLELASAHGGRASNPFDVESWSAVLEVPATTLRSVLRRLVGGAEARHRALVEGVTEAGLYQLAGKLSEGERFVLDRAAAGDTVEADPVADADLPLLLDWFQGRENVHAREAVSGTHRTFVPVRRPLTEDDWRAHLAGERTLGLPLIRADGTVSLGVVDVDVMRQEIDLRHGVPDELMGRALGAALGVRKAIEAMGGAALLELSGHKGYHLWVRLESPAPSRELRGWLHAAVESASPLPEGIRAEVFPNRDRVREGSVGPLVKLPLGMHSKTGQRCAILDERGEPVADPYEAIRTLPRLPRSSLEEGLMGRAAKSPSGTNAAESLRDGLGAKANEVLEGCAVLRFLADKAARTSYLVHSERRLLRDVLAHLGPDGDEAIHRIVGRCYNYRREVTARHVKKVPPSPVSCPRIRELHPEITRSVSCDCRFSLRGGGYPTPLLHALRPGEITAFRERAARKSAAASRADPSPSRASSEAEILHEAELKVKKLAELKRHLRGLQGSIARTRGELSAIFDTAGSDVLTLTIGQLRRSVRDDGSVLFVIEV